MRTEKGQSYFTNISTELEDTNYPPTQHTSYMYPPTEHTSYPPSKG